MKERPLNQKYVSKLLTGGVTQSKEKQPSPLPLVFGRVVLPLCKNHHRNIIQLWRFFYMYIYSLTHNASVSVNTELGFSHFVFCQYPHSLYACPSPPPTGKSSISGGPVQPPQLPVHDLHHGRHGILLQAAAGHLLQEDSR